MKKNIYKEKIKFAILSNSVFEIGNDNNFNLVSKIWWKNSIIHTYSYKNQLFLLCHIGFGITNSSMFTTYILNNYKNLKYIINLDFLNSNFMSEKIRDNLVYSLNFAYSNADFSKFTSTGKGQIFEEKSIFSFDSEKLQKMKNFKFGRQVKILKSSDIVNKSSNLEEFILDSESTSIAQVANKFNIEMAAIKIVNSFFPNGKNENLNYMGYLENMIKFKFTLKKVIIFFLDEYNWNIFKLSDEVFLFLLEMNSFENLGIFKTILKSTKNITAINKNDMIISNFNNFKSRKVKFIVINDKESKLDKNRYNYLNDNFLKGNLKTKNIVLNLESVFFCDSKFSKEKKHYKIYAKLLYEEIKKANFDFESETKNLVIKMEINYSFILLWKKGNDIIDDESISTAIFTIKILKEANRLFLEEYINFKKIWTYLYINNNGKLFIYKVKAIIRKGFVKFIFNKKDPESKFNIAHHKL